MQSQRSLKRASRSAISAEPVCIPPKWAFWIPRVSIARTTASVKSESSQPAGAGGEKPKPSVSKA